MINVRGRVVLQRAKKIMETAEPPVKGDPDRPEGSRRHLGDLLMAQAREPAQEEDLSLKRRQTGHGPLQPFLKRPPLQLGQRARRGVSDLLKFFVIWVFGMCAHPPEAVYQQVPRDRKEPGPEGSGGAVVMAVNEHSEEGLLEEVLGSRVVAQRVKEEVEHHSVMPVIEGLEGDNASRPYVLHQDFV